MATEDAPALEFEKVHVVPLGRAEAYRLEGEAISLGDPDSWIFVFELLFVYICGSAEVEYIGKELQYLFVPKTFVASEFLEER